MEHRTTDELRCGLAAVAAAPADGGTVELITCRPGPAQRRILAEASLTSGRGLDGDNWLERGSRHTPDGRAEPSRQLTLMNARAIELIAGPDRERWAQAGDQLYVDLDLSEANLPPGTKLRLGSSVIEISDAPHPGCAKFAARFGRDAASFVLTPEARALRVRGANAVVVESGVVATGDAVTRL